MTEEYTQNQENLIPANDKPTDESESIDTNHDLLNRSEPFAPAINIPENLYHNINSTGKYDEMKNFNINKTTNLNTLLDVISLIDGKRNIMEISNFLNLNIEDIINTVELLISKKLVKF